ncbi:hypothetical protein [Streptomyces sp. SID13588]|uniref:hypothetical protein n=1 Tax=Streptomyces sp. SID13588 TaxID=2706051 RepID=UPI0019418BB7|nr:hypothetical protein [Streptomyces sp. SID13588]
MDQPTEYTGRTGSCWTSRDILLRPGHLRPSGAAIRPGQATRMVWDEAADVYGALRGFPSRRSRGEAVAVLAVGSPVTPALLDMVDHPDLPPSVVTAWAPGESRKPLSALKERDDLGAMLEIGHRWAPAEALRLLVPLGRALDDLDRAGFNPVELSPDHVVVNSGSLNLVGVGRHGYIPGEGRQPGPQGMSLPTTLLLGDDLPGSGVGLLVQWREVQLRALLRLVGWMCCGLPPASYGSVRGLTDLGDYLAYAGFTQVPALKPGYLADSLAYAAQFEETEQARLGIEKAAALLIYEDPAQGEARESRLAWATGLSGHRWQATVVMVRESSLRVSLTSGTPKDWELPVDRWDTPEAAEWRDAGGRTSSLDLRAFYSEGQSVAVDVGPAKEVPLWPNRFPTAKGTLVRATAPQPRPMLTQSRLEINPESVRLGLLHDHGPRVLALAAFSTAREGTGLASQLSGAGWVLVRPEKLAENVARVIAAAPGARVMVAGRLSAAVEAMAAQTPRPLERVNPQSAEPAPMIAGRPADQLPYLTDRKLEAYEKEVLLNGTASMSMRRRTFAAGWALALGGIDALPARGRRKRLELMAACFGTNTELLVTVRARQNAPGLRDISSRIDDDLMRRQVTALSGVPMGEFRRSLMSALLGASYEDPYDATDRRLLPVSAALATVFMPEHPIGADGLTMDDALREPSGICRVGLYGRLCTAVPWIAPSRLAESVEVMDDALVKVLNDIPAPSLQFLAGRLEDPGLLVMLEPYLDGPDRELLNRYTPAMWRLLLDGLRQPEHLGHLGLGWVQVVAQDPDARVDARVLLRIAADSGVPPQQTIRSLMTVAPEHWGAVCERAELAARWLSEEGSLEIGPLLQQFPDAEALLGRFGTRGLRLALNLGLDQRALDRLGWFAEALQVPLESVLMVFQERGYEAVQAEGLDLAAVEWCRWRTARRIASGRSAKEALSWVLGHALEHREMIMRWAVDGEALEQQVTAELLALPPEAPLVDRAEARVVAARVLDSLELLPLLRLLDRPQQRTALLALHRQEAQALRDTRVPGQLALILAEPDPRAALLAVVHDDTPVVLQRAARRLGLGPEQRRVLSGFVPLLDVLPDQALGAVAALGSRHGTAAAATAAVLEQSLPGASAAVLVWGAEWLPLLAGPAARRVLKLLVEQQAQYGDHAAQLSPWLLLAGTDGLALIERFGSDALALVRATGAPPQDARLLGELLMLPGPPADLYRLITGYGLPARCWPLAAALLARGADDHQVLLALWCARSS